MSPLAITAAIFAVMLVLMALRTPIAVAMFVAGSIGYVAQAGWAPFANFLNAQAFARFASYDLSVIPLFILMGNFASQGGISRALFEFASAVMGRFRGGLAMAAVLASGAFGAIRAEQNIAKLFAAAMVPGIIAMLGYIFAIAIYVRLVPGQAPEIEVERTP